MLHHFIAADIFRYKGPHFDVLDGDLLHADLAAEHLHQLLFGDVLPPGQDTLDLDAFQVVVHALPQAIEGHLDSIRDKRKDRILQVMVDRAEYLSAQIIAKGDPFPVDLFVTAPGKVDSFKAAGPAFLWFQDGLYRRMAICPDNQPFSGHQLHHLVLTDIEYGSDRRTFGSGNDYVFVDV